MSDIAIETVTFASQDGWALEGSLYRGADPKMAILISAGTGFPRSFYHHAALYLAGQGAVVLTYDYRGMGGSNTDPSGFAEIEYTDWGRYDMPAAVARLADAAAGLPVTHVAHSVGGHFLGLMPNHDAIARHAFVSVGTGYFGGHHLSYRPVGMFFWWLLGPLLIWKNGAVTPGIGWQGEALPPKLFRTWRRWSMRRPYLTVDFGGRMEPQHYSEVTSPIRAWVFPDDPIATPRAAADLLGSYPNAPSEIVKRAPADLGVKRIAHEGAFRKGREKLWGEIWDWLNAC